MQPNPRIPDPAGARMAELARARVPDEVTALRARLEELRRQEHGPEVRAAIDKTSAAIDDLITALVRDMLGASSARRQGHR